MVEMAIAIPLVFAIMYVVIDLARYWAVQGVLSQGAQQGVNLAIKIPNLEIDNENDSDFLQARMRIICGDDLDCRTDPSKRNGDAVRIPLSTLVANWDDTNAAVRFVGFPDYDLATGVRHTVNAIVLRPGDPCVADRDGVLHCHPTVCPRSTSEPCAPTARRRQSGESMTALMRSEPIVVEMPAKFKTMLPIPLLGVYSMRGVSAGYREIISSGAYPIPAGEVPTLGNTPTPTPTPTEPSGPTNTPAPTNTSGPTNTPAPTNTSGPTNTPAPTNTPPIPCPGNNCADYNDACINGSGGPSGHESGNCAYCDAGTCRCHDDCGSGEG